MRTLFSNKVFSSIYITYFSSLTRTFSPPQPDPYLEYTYDTHSPSLDLLEIRLRQVCVNMLTGVRGREKGWKRDYMKKECNIDDKSPLDSYETSFLFSSLVSDIFVQHGGLPLDLPLTLPHTSLTPKYRNPARLLDSKALHCSLSLSLSLSSLSFSFSICVCIVLSVCVSSGNYHSASIRSHVPIREISVTFTDNFSQTVLLSLSLSLSLSHSFFRSIFPSISCIAHSS